MPTTIGNNEILTGSGAGLAIRPNGSYSIYVDGSNNIFLAGKTSTSSTQNGAYFFPGYGFLQLYRPATAGALRFWNTTTGLAVGSVQINTSSTSYLTTSDYRLKENIVPMTGGLEKVLQLNPVTFTWKADGAVGEGFIAHELQAFCPEAVTGVKDGTKIEPVVVSEAVEPTFDENGNELTPFIEAVYEEQEIPEYQGVDTSFLVARLTAAIQELSAKNDALEARISALEGV